MRAGSRLATRPGWGRWLGAGRIAFALLGLAAVVTQYANGTERATFEPSNFLSFFTIQSNLIAAGVLLVAGASALRGRSPGRRLDAWRGAATLYMATTGIVYTLLLRGLEESLQTPLPWVNAVLHYVMPVVLVADWVVDRAAPIGFARALAWLGYPLAYVGYSLIRGPIVDWYPYPFLDPREDGYGAVLLVAAGIAVAMLGLAWLVARRTRGRF